MKSLILRDWEVRAILDGRLTQLRRVVNLSRVRHAVTGISVDPETGQWTAWDIDHPYGETPECWDATVLRCPLGSPGDVLLVREAWGWNGCLCCPEHYRATEPDWADESPLGAVWRPASTMPKSISRITLEVVRTRVERVQDMTREDAMACGVVECDIPADEDGPLRVGYMIGPDDGKAGLDVRPQESYAKQWNLDNPKHPWDANPWVWAAEIRKVER